MFGLWAVSWPRCSAESLSSPDVIVSFCLCFSFVYFFYPRYRYCCRCCCFVSATCQKKGDGSTKKSRRDKGDLNPFFLTSRPPSPLDLDLAGRIIPSMRNKRGSAYLPASLFLSASTFFFMFVILNDQFLTLFSLSSTN